MKFFLFKVIVFSSFSLLSQNNVSFNFNGNSFSETTFEKNTYDYNSAQFSLNTSRYKAPSPDKLKDGVQIKKGFRMVFSIENHKYVVPLKKGDTLRIGKTGIQVYNEKKKANEELQKSSSTKKIQNELKILKEEEKERLDKNSFVLAKIDAALKKKSEEIKVLTKKIMTGEEDAIKKMDVLSKEIVDLTNLKISYGFR